MKNPLARRPGLVYASIAELERERKEVEPDPPEEDMGESGPVTEDHLPNKEQARFTVEQVQDDLSRSQGLMEEVLGPGTWRVITMSDHANEIRQIFDKLTKKGQDDLRTTGWLIDRQAKREGWTEGRLVLEKARAARAMRDLEDSWRRTNRLRKEGRV